MIDISKYDKRDVLIALYDRAKVQGLGFLHAKEGSISRKEAGAILKEHAYFDYLFGRVMKVDLHDDKFDPRLYDRDNGAGAAQGAISGIE